MADYTTSPSDDKFWNQEFKGFFNRKTPPTPQDESKFASAIKSRDKYYEGMDDRQTIKWWVNNNSDHLQNIGLLSAKFKAKPFTPKESRTSLGDTPLGRAAGVAANAAGSHAIQSLTGSEKSTLKGVYEMAGQSGKEVIEKILGEPWEQTREHFPGAKAAEFVYGVGKSAAGMADTALFTPVGVGLTATGLEGAAPAVRAAIPAAISTVGVVRTGKQLAAKGLPETPSEAGELTGDIAAAVAPAVHGKLGLRDAKSKAKAYESEGAKAKARQSNGPAGEYPADIPEQIQRHTERLDRINASISKVDDIIRQNKERLEDLKIQPTAPAESGPDSPAEIQKIIDQNKKHLDNLLKEQDKSASSVAEYNRHKSRLDEEIDELTEKRKDATDKSEKYAIDARLAELHELTERSTVKPKGAGEPVQGPAAQQAEAQSRGQYGELGQAAGTRETPAAPPPVRKVETPSTIRRPPARGTAPEPPVMPQGTQAGGPPPEVRNGRLDPQPFAQHRMYEVSESAMKNAPSLKGIGLKPGQVIYYSGRNSSGQPRILFVDESTGQPVGHAKLLSSTISDETLRRLFRPHGIPKERPSGAAPSEPGAPQSPATPPALSAPPPARPAATDGTPKATAPASQQMVSAVTSAVDTAKRANITKLTVTPLDAAGKPIAGAEPISIEISQSSPEDILKHAGALGSAALLKFSPEGGTGGNVRSWTKFVEPGNAPSEPGAPVPEARGEEIVSKGIIRGYPAGTKFKVLGPSNVAPGKVIISSPDGKNYHATQEDLSRFFGSNGK